MAIKDPERIGGWNEDFPEPRTGAFQRDAPWTWEQKVCAALMALGMVMAVVVTVYVLLVSP